MTYEKVSIVKIGKITEKHSLQYIHPSLTKFKGSVAHKRQREKDQERCCNCPLEWGICFDSNHGGSEGVEEIKNGCNAKTY
jgi:hypothetical protein